MEANYLHVCDHVHHCDNCNRGWCTCELLRMEDAYERGKTWLICTACGKKLTWSKITYASTSE